MITIDRINLLLAFGPMSLARMQQDFFGQRLGSKEWHEYKNRGVEQFCRENIYHVIVAEVDNKVVGYATYILDKERGIASIGNNAVHPEYQGKGIGGSMQKEVKRRMLEEGYSRFAVDTLAVDLPARKIYERLGYKKYAETYYYLKKEDLAE